MYRATKALRDVQKKDLIPVAISPLIGGKMPMENRVVECFRILSKEYDNVPEDDLRRLQAVLYILAQKFLKQEEMGRIKEHSCNSEIIPIE